MQPDTVIPDLSSPQSWNRYSYVTNRPVNFSDPTGHKVEEGCGTGGTDCNPPPPDPDEYLNDDEDDPTVLLFCGSGGDALSDGPGCPDQMPAWDDNPNGYMMYFQQYRGGKYRTATFAGELGIPNNVLLILICYSAGSEACLMYTKKRLADGGLVQSVALLGPTFSGKNENGIDLSFEGPNGGWKSYVDELLVNGTDIMIVDDNDGDNFKYALGINSPTAAQGYMPPESAKGDFLYTYTDAKHWTDHPNWITATNTWDFLSDFTFNTLDAMATP